MAGAPMSTEVMELIAHRFRALGDRTRLQLLNALRDGECTVTELVEATGLAQANVSKHLQLLHSLGFLKRRRDGLFTWYAIADKSVFKLCDIMCGRLDSEAAARRRVLTGRS